MTVWTCPKCARRNLGLHCWTTGCGAYKPREKAVRHVPDVAPIPDRAGRLQTAIRAQYECTCGAVKRGDMCANCGRCFRHDVPVNGCACPLEAE